jgi:hypothetical protein
MSVQPHSLGLAVFHFVPTVNTDPFSKHHKSLSLVTEIWTDSLSSKVIYIKLTARIMLTPSEPLLLYVPPALKLKIYASHPRCVFLCSVRFSE